MGRKPNDMSREYCTIIDHKNSHLRCNFCGHKMQGITRFKEHLAGKRGDVSPCKSCPADVKGKIVEALIQLSFKREARERRTREALRSSIANALPPPPPPPPPPPATAALPPPLLLSNNNKKRPAAAATADLQAEERALMEKVVKESLQTFEMEKRKTVRNNEDDDFETAIRESMRSYKEDAWRRGEGCSKYARAGPSSFGNNFESIDVDSDYDSDDDDSSV